MNNFTFFSPTKFVFGKNTETEVGALLKEFGATNVLIHYGGGSVVKSGLLSKVIASIEAKQIRHIELGGVLPNPRSGLVYEGIALCKKEKVDFVLAVGGGSAIDSAKAIALGALYDGDFWDFYDWKKRAEKNLPVGVVLTIPAAGSEGSTNAVITKEPEMLKRGIGSDSMRPKFAIVNPELTYTIPAYHAAAGVIDMMGHILERYFTRTEHVELTDALCEASLSSIMGAARRMIKDPFDYEARATICWAGTIAHNGSLGVGRVEDWATHILEHEVSALFDVSHGAGLGVLFPSYIRHVVKTDVQRFRRLAVNAFGVKDIPNDPLSTALAGVDAYVAFVKELGLPTTLREFGVKREDIQRLVDSLVRNRGTKVGMFQPLSPADALSIYTAAY